MIRIDAGSYDLVKRAKSPFLAEKDMLECLILSELFKHPYFAKNVVFVGGSSLSKSYGFTQRVGSDIDLVFHNLPLLPYDRSRNQLKTYNKNFRKFVFDDIQRLTCSIINKDRQFLIINDRDLNTMNRRYDVESTPTLHIFYESKFQFGPGKISLEMGPRKYPENVMHNCPVTPYSTKKTLAYIPTVICEQTFWDKINALHMNAFIENPYCARSYSRHYYDVANMAGAVNLFYTHHLLNNTIKYQQVYTFRKNYTTDYSEGVTLIPNDNVLEQLGQDYVNMSDKFTISQKTWEGVVGILFSLQKRIRQLQ